MSVNFFQAILLILLSGIRALDTYSTQTFGIMMHGLYCWFVGIVLGQPGIGLVVGGTIQLMSMGALGLGGSSAPDYGMAGMVATLIACSNGTADDASISAGLAIGVAVAMLFVQLDVLFKIYNSWVFSMVRSAAVERNYPKMLRRFFLSHLYLFLQGAIPMALAVFSTDAINAILAAMPEWLTNGLNVAAGILPVTGFAMLLTFMPLNKFWVFAVAGFVLAAYFNLGVLPIALLAMVVAVEYFRLHTSGSFASGAAALNGGELEDE